MDGFAVGFAALGLVAGGLFVVVGSQWQRIGRRPPSLYATPEVEFTDSRGRRRTFLHPAGSGNVRPKPGRRVQVLYDPGNDDEPPVIHGEPAHTLLPWLILLIGAVVLVVHAFVTWQVLFSGGR